MYYIITYDCTSPKRLPKLLKTCRRYLNWVQNSVFEGDLTRSQFLDLRMRLAKIIEKKNDSIILYEIRNRDVVDKEILGIEKNEITFMI
ncbi:MAG: CRISPR-associated endonuclease Cas2 [Melioribacter sp.]|nr:CRISPR-associated endonuclease Cas2 [Melioribacter sp.]